MPTLRQKSGILPAITSCNQRGTGFLYFSIRRDQPAHENVLRSRRTDDGKTAPGQYTAASRISIQGRRNLTGGQAPNARRSRIRTHAGAQGAGIAGRPGQALSGAGARRRLGKLISPAITYMWKLISRLESSC